MRSDSSNPDGDIFMDLLYLGLIVGFTLISIALVYGLERLGRSS
jgi:hypothetical protein